MENNLKNRYIYAVTRHLPTKIQADVEKELESLITEMAEERSGNNIPSEQTIKDVLADLGSPEEMALKYYGSERTALISGIYFLMYKRVLLIVLPIVAAVLACLTIINFVVGDEPTVYIPIIIGNVNIVGLSFVSQLIASVVGGLVQAFAVITGIFAVLDYMKVDLKGDDSTDLPEVPEARLKISPFWPIFEISLSVSLTALFLVFPHVMSIRLESEWITVFNIPVIRGLWFPFMIWAVLEIISEIVKLVDGRYTMRLAVVSIITGILCAVCAIVVFGNDAIINPAIINLLGEVGYGFEALGGIFITARPNIVIMTISLIVIFFETLDDVVKAFQSRNR